MNILWDNRSGCDLPDGWPVWLTDVIRRGLRYMPNQAWVPRTEISVSFVDADEIRDLNGEYRQIDRETDVLSFPFFTADALADTPMASDTIALGDIVVCVSVAAAQAALYGHSLKRELAFLTVHGLLHLLGYDHEGGGEAERAMLDAQEAILRDIPK